MSVGKRLGDGYAPSMALACMALLLSGQALAEPPSHCPVTYQQLERALRESVHASGGPQNGGLPVNEWAAVVDRAGTVCAVARSGPRAQDQWLGSRAIAVEKADTANAFDLDKYGSISISTRSRRPTYGRLRSRAATSTARVSAIPRCPSISTPAPSPVGEPSRIR